MNFKRYGEKEHLKAFEPIFLDQMKEVELMNRVDTKFVVGRNTFNKILPELVGHYKVLEVNDTRMSAYNTQYFDSPGFRFYLAHHNGKGLRYKVRIRKYVESDIFFLEIKKKFKERTIKKRMSVVDFEEHLTEGSEAYVQAVIGEEIPLESKLYNTFDRITLVNKKDMERLTLDMNLGYKFNGGSELHDYFVVAELKQERLNTQSLFYRLMKENVIRPIGFSKYCFGAMSGNADLKYNQFKQKVLLLDKLN